MSTLNKDRIHSETSKENFRQGQLNLYKNGYISPRGRKIKDKITGEIFNSISELSKKLGLSGDTLRNNLEGKNKVNKYINFEYYKHE